VIAVQAGNRVQNDHHGNREKPGNERNRLALARSPPATFPLLKFIATTQAASRQ